MAQTAQLEDFDEALYKVGRFQTFCSLQVSGSSAADDQYLIATSEQPISALHSEENIDPKTLPIR